MQRRHCIVLQISPWLLSSDFDVQTFFWRASYQWVFSFLRQLDYLSKGSGSALLHKLSSSGIFKQSMRARNRVGTGLSYGRARLHRLAELFPWNRFLGSMKV
jgi:hypothetical protein